MTMVWIRTIPPEEATGRLAEAYAWQSRKLGRPTEFTQLGSLDAEIVYARLVLYRASENVPSRLTPSQRQLIAYLVSVLNATPHCASLARPRLDASTLAALDGRDYDSLPRADAALALYVDKLTLRPGDVVDADIQDLRDAGFDDLDILQPHNQCA